MNISSDTVSTLLGVIACQRAAITLQMPVPVGQRHLKRTQCEDADDALHSIMKKRRILAPLPRRLPSMSTAAGVRAAVEARAIARMTSVAVSAATLVGATTLCPPPPPPCPTVRTSAHAAASVPARSVEGRQIAMCRVRREVRDVEMKDVSSSLPLPLTAHFQPAPVTVTVPHPQFQQASRSVLAARKIAMPRKRMAKKDDDVEDMDVDD
ncbi:hypothetical protein BG011_003098 [Mortierella polycephala]|uniref:Nuclear pore complex NUP2/50/61 domain-containing protein n=1 Tax=Mortierella polycephala TaxID=41804 RepID=A0A9P6PK90_9FUNG|nr:hypothetical protein BG011_003098 [Mortierella polycephala]